MWKHNSRRTSAVAYQRVVLAASIARPAFVDWVLVVFARCRRLLRKWINNAVASYHVNAPLSIMSCLLNKLRNNGGSVQRRRVHPRCRETVDKVGDVFCVVKTHTCRCTDAYTHSYTHSHTLTHTDIHSDRQCRMVLNGRAPYTHCGVWKGQARPCHTRCLMWHTHQRAEGGCHRGWSLLPLHRYYCVIC